MSPNNDINMIINSTFDLFEKNCDNYDEMRGCSLVLSIHHPRSPSLSSSEYDKDYAMRVQRESDRMVEDNHVALYDSPQLEYIAPKSQDNQVSKIADPTTNSRHQHIVNISPVLNNESTASNNIVNI